MTIRRLGNESIPLTPEIETTASKPPAAPAMARATEDAEANSEKIGRRVSSLSTPRGPIDDPLSKSFLLQKLEPGNQGSLPTTPSTRMRDNEVDTKGGGDDGGGDVGPGDATGKDSGNGDVGIGLSHRSRLDGDPHTKNTEGGSNKNTGATTQPQGGGTNVHELNRPHETLQPVVGKKVS